MPRRYLFGPVNAEFARENLQRHRDDGHCLVFDHQDGLDLTIGREDSWGSIVSKLPADWRPDFVALQLAYTTIPAGLWQAPVPLVGLAGDWNLLWHHYRRRLRSCELILTDSLGVEKFRREGFEQARVAGLYGCGRSYLEIESAAERDIDILFVGNLNPAVQRARLYWLGRLARLRERHRVEIHTGVFGKPYRELLARSKIVFNLSIRGECNARVFEAAAAGALLFQEQGNLEVPLLFRDRAECVYYTAEDFDRLIDHYLDHEDERRAIAKRAHARIAEFTYESQWARQLELIEAEWPAMVERVQHRPMLTGDEDLHARTWQMLGASPNRDDTLFRDLRARNESEPSSALLNAFGITQAYINHLGSQFDASLAASTIDCFQRAWAADGKNVVAGLNVVEALAGLERYPQAIEQAKRVLASLEGDLPLDLDGAHFPPVYDSFRVEWERAAWDHAGDRHGELQAKIDLIRWRLHTYLAEFTGELGHYYEACVARADLPTSRAALGAALCRANRFVEAIPHLRRAVRDNPLDSSAARILFHALGAVEDRAGQSRLGQERRLLAATAPCAVRAEATYEQAAVQAQPAPLPVAADQLKVSLCMIVKNEEANLPDCLGSCQGLFDEIVVVDTGSTDRTREVAARFGARLADFPWVDSFCAARNESLRHATGDWVFWMDADDRLDEENRAKLKQLFANLKDENVAYSMKCLCVPDRESGTATVVDHVRLFRNHPQLRWRYRVHEQILPAIRSVGGDVRWADVVIRHVGYQDPALRRRKLDRDLRLLNLENEDHPDDPFTLFNLGMVYQELGQIDKAVPALRRSLERSHPNDSIVRKLYALLAQCHRHLGQRELGLAACRKGREFYPDDTELLFQEGMACRDLGDATGAEQCWLRLLVGKGGQHFASVDTGIAGYKTRHNLAVMYREQKRDTEAEAQWQRALEEQPAFVAAWLGLGELYLGQQLWDKHDEVVAKLEQNSCPLDAAILRARAHQTRREFDRARVLLEDTIVRAPGAVYPNRVLSHVLLQEGSDPTAAERVLRRLLELVPDDPEATNNLAVLLREPG